MTRTLALALTLTLLASAALAETPVPKPQNEDYWNRKVCAELGGQAEIRTKAGTDADCVTSRTAYEADWSGKWAEAIGQALHYASEFDLRPGVILLCKESDVLCLRHELRMKSTIGAWFDLDDWDFEIVDAR